MLNFLIDYESPKCITVVLKPQQVLCGTFTVASGKTVRFSKGNLQYRASTGTWRFADSQTTAIGNNVGNTTSSNRASSASWIDLYRYGTSGYNSKYPYMTDNTESTYPNADLDANTDWGRYNDISNGGRVTGLWHTLSSAEWDYLLNNADRSDTRYIKAIVGSMECVLLFPDNYSHPSGYPALTNRNRHDVKSSETIFSATQFAEMEKLGVVCFPSTGYQNSGATVVDYYSNYGNYWTTTMSDISHKPYYFYFQAESAQENSMSHVGLNANAAFGFAVRLVVGINGRETVLKNKQ